MNQFKRAKQLNSQTESITDLKTAGVVTPKENSTKQDTEESIKKEETIIPDKSNTENLPVKTQSEGSNNTQTVISEGTTALLKTESPAIAAEQSSDVVTTQTPKTEAIPYNVPTMKPEVVSQPAAYYEAPPVQTINTQPQVILPQQVVQPIVQPQYTEAAITHTPEPIETKPAKSSKKSAPNMFTQKNESKSIRKSLVLRPSSVKIAENYCAKNGGSFNELIQILLDNFIEEYGL